MCSRLQTVLHAFLLVIVAIAFCCMLVGIKGKIGENECQEKEVVVPIAPKIGCKRHNAFFSYLCLIFLPNLFLIVRSSNACFYSNIKTALDFNIKGRKKKKLQRAAENQ